MNRHCVAPYGLCLRGEFSNSQCVAFDASDFCEVRVSMHLVGEAFEPLVDRVLICSRGGVKKFACNIAECG